MLNIVICDDDTDFREIVEYKVRNCLAGFFETDYNIQIVSDLNRLAEVLADTKVDVLFLDIMVNNENSMNWSINNIRSSYTQIIFMTSFPAKVVSLLFSLSYSPSSAPAYTPPIWKNASGCCQPSAPGINHGVMPSAAIFSQAAFSSS